MLDPAVGNTIMSQLRNFEDILFQIIVMNEFSLLLEHAANLCNEFERLPTS